MRNLFLTPIVLAALFIQTGCAVGLTARPTGVPTIYVPSRPAPHPLPPPPPPAPLSAREAISLGHSWCNQQGYACRLDDADLVKGKSRWKVKFDAEAGRGRGRHHRGKPSRGKVKLEFDAWNGGLLKVQTTGKLRG